MGSMPVPLDPPPTPVANVPAPVLPEPGPELPEEPWPPKPLPALPPAEHAVRRAMAEVPSPHDRYRTQEGEATGDMGRSSSESRALQASPRGGSAAGGRKREESREQPP